MTAPHSPATVTLMPDLPPESADPDAGTFHPAIPRCASARQDTHLVGACADSARLIAAALTALRVCACESCALRALDARVSLVVARQMVAAARSGDWSKLEKLAACAEELDRA